jgi:hypothetical protein
MAFDTLAYMKRLEAGGITRDQAEAHAEAINDYLRPDLATTDDITRLGIELGARMAGLDARMAGLEQRIMTAIASLRQDMAQRETRLVTVFITAVGALLGITVALLKLT